MQVERQALGRKRYRQAGGRVALQFAQHVAHQQSVDQMGEAEPLQRGIACGAVGLLAGQLRFMI